jgi:two-component sensor histidine kinase
MDMGYDVKLNHEARELRRLAALADYDVLDTPSERDFDEVAELASEICETPIAVVNLIADGRQFFKAEVGLGVRETPLDSSFCAKAILEEDFLVVPDATKDPRFDCNPLVTGEPGLRFYAGALLKSRDGYPIGTVCVLDYKPRPLTAMQEKALRVLARQVMRQLELRRTVRERDEAQAQQDILNREILHRMKNTLAMVQAIANQTLRGVTEQEAVEALTQRIAALGTASDQLMKENWSAAPLRRIVRLLLDLHGSGGRIETSGPDIDLGPKATLSISLLLHELATNAAKYGSLSVPEGCVTLSWRIEEGDEPMMVMNWGERDGPTIEEPKLRSFGTRLIRLGLVGKGGVEKSYPPTGFVAEFRASMDDIHAL